MRKITLLLMVQLLMFSLVFAQVHPVSGKVTDEKGDPVPFATVKVKGSKVAEIADANGLFQIKANKGAILEVSSIGYKSNEITVGTGNSLTVIISKTLDNLNEVVVQTALGVKRQAKELGYSTSKITADELTVSKSTNIATGLTAKVSGLQINLVNNGVKADTRITLRGNRSFLGNNQALLVIDDIQTDISYLSSLNPNDVDNVTVLKGASASALYGSAASNGVIIITTKKGIKGKARVTLSSTVNLESISYMPELQNSFGQFGGENDPNAYPGIIAMPGSQPGVYYVPYENQNYGVSTINDIAYSAGDDKSKFYLSFEDVNTSGVLPGDVSRRNTIRLNGSRESGIFRADYTLGYTLNHTNTTPGTGVPFTYGTTSYTGGYGATSGGSYFQNRPVYWTVINTPANVDLRKYRDWQHNPFASPDGYFNAYYGNPWWQIDQTRLDEKSANLIGNISLTLTPFKWLSLNYKAGIVRNDYNNKYTQAGYDFAAWAIADTLGAGNIPSGVKKLSPSEGDALSYNQRLTSDFLASAHHSFGNFDVRFIAGTSLIDRTLRLMNSSAAALVIPNFFNISNRLGNPTVGEYKEETRLMGIFGDLTVGYKNYLFLHGSLRNDWNSILSESNRSYLYPAVDAAFVFTDAIPAFKNQNILNFGKLRVAHSLTAQASIGAYALQNTFNVGGGFPFGGVAGYSVNGSYANPNIKNELSTDNEIGLELGFLKNRFNISAAYYSTHTTNQTIPIGISSTTGYIQAYVNSGEMDNSGVELDLKITPLLKTKDGLRWDIGVNFAYNKNTVVDAGSQYGLTQVALSGNSIAKVGLPYGQVQTNDWKRDPQGRIIVSATTGYPILDPTPKLFGTSNAPTKVGFNTTLSYKGFTFNALMDGRFGAVIFNSLGSSMDFTGVSAYSAQSGRQPFVIPNSSYLSGTTYVPNTNILTKDGNLSFWANIWNTAGSNYVNSADFWKLREISLAYTFPRKLIAPLKVVNNLSLAVVGRNLITWKAKGNVWSDPEFANTTGNATGLTDINQLPPTKFYGFNLTVTF
ncbi:MAG: SusC/RagA family TonB-linked outer membrane protein [Sphingobacteriales bacterium]|nr:SusC/RagA family TonB-linked outer membrane protein [Sphingobacteriales bacterium]